MEGKTGDILLLQENRHSVRQSCVKLIQLDRITNSQTLSQLSQIVILFYVSFI